MYIKKILTTLLLVAPVASYADNKLHLEVDNVRLSEAWQLLKNYCGDTIADYSFLHPNRSVTLRYGHIECKEAALILKDHDSARLQDGETPDVNSGTNAKNSEG